MTVANLCNNCNSSLNDPKFSCSSMFCRDKSSTVETALTTILSYNKLIFVNSRRRTGIRFTVRGKNGQKVTLIEQPAPRPLPQPTFWYQVSGVHGSSPSSIKLDDFVYDQRPQSKVYVQGDKIIVDICNRCSINIKSGRSRCTRKRCRGNIGRLHSFIMGIMRERLDRDYFVDEARHQYPFTDIGFHNYAFLDYVENNVRY